MRTFARSPAPGFASLPSVVRLVPASAAGILLVVSCRPDPEPPPDPGEPCVDEGRRRCEGSSFQVCTAGFWTTQEECASPTPQCSVSLGCIACGAGQDYCLDNSVYHCLSDGASWSLVQDCGEEVCRWGECYEPCDLADAENTYLGCEFLAIPTANSMLDPAAFGEDFAVVVGNPDDERAAEVRVAQGGQVVTTAVIDPRSTQAITLPYHDDLKWVEGSVLVPGAAYEVLSNVPVVAYQYNPLNFQSGGTFSYTNDASLLLPVAALGQQHLVSGWPTWGIVDWEQWLWSPGFVAVTTATDGTSVFFTSSAWTLASTSSHPGDLPALHPGQLVEVVLNRGDVLQILSEKGPAAGTCDDLEGAISGNAASYDYDYPVCLDVLRGDLTGTWISSTAPIAVFAGHDCTFMPFDSWACDHLEESVLPLEVWGTEAVVSAPTRPGGSGIVPSIVRVLAQYDGTEIRFLPEIHEPVVAGPAQVVELRVEEDVLVRAHTPIVVTQFLLGQDELGTAAGDPAFGTMPPTNHWRQAYEFLVPTTYTDNYVNLVSQISARVILDDEEIDGWTEIQDTPYQVFRARLTPGPHSAWSDTGDPFGLVAYGYASYTSYLYPGGLDLTHNPQP